MLNINVNMCDSNNITLTRSEFTILNIIYSKSKNKLSKLSKKIIANSTNISIPHVKYCLNTLHKKYKFIEIMPRFCSVSGKQLANQYVITDKGYLFLSSNKPPLKKKEIKYFSNNFLFSSFSIFILESEYKNQISEASKQYENIKDFDHIAKTKEFFSHNKIKCNYKEDNIKGWIRWYHNWMINAVEHMNKKEQEEKLDIFQLDCDKLLSPDDLIAFKVQDLSNKVIQKIIQKFKIHHCAIYKNNPEVKKTKTKWYQDLLGWIHNAIEMIAKGEKQVRISIERYISEFRNIGKEITEKLGEKKAEICLNLFAKYHKGKENTILVWNKLRDGWIKKAIENITTKENKQMIDYEAMRDDKIREIASKMTKQEIKTIADKALLDERLQSAICRIYSLPCYTQNDRLGREIREEILINMDRYNQYDTDMLDMISKISIKVPVEGVLGISVNDYYYSSNRIREKELLEISRKMVEYGIVKKYRFIQIEDRDRGEVIWKK